MNDLHLRSASMPGVDSVNTSGAVQTLLNVQSFANSNKNAVFGGMAAMGQSVASSVTQASQSSLQPTFQHMNSGEVNISQENMLIVQSHP